MELKIRPAIFDSADLRIMDRLNDLRLFNLPPK